ncbi:unnamed protein product [Microthlaspi erraticum]|uniref:Reverse transcriptase zinc-binding domain-containing protein n=1 Tax=Microthlaspi erraticum TaxID=1685480 RepID=A0A6D2KS94_9BRAS|nr:unnamed protein product [Microthlaspi erraticum]
MVWRVASSHSSLWVKWTKTYLLKQESFWSLQSKRTLAWAPGGIWFTHSTPKFSFHAWLAILDRLTLHGRPNDILDCKHQPLLSVFCQHPVETRSHLFFTCIFSAAVWCALTKGLLKRNYSLNWQDIISFISDNTRPHLILFLTRYVFQATIHSIWKERNSRRHGEQPLASNNLITVIDKHVRNRVSSIRLLGDTKYEEALYTWLAARS